MPYRVFNLAEAAEYLHLTEDRVESWPAAGTSVRRQGGRLMFATTPLTNGRRAAC